MRLAQRTLAIPVSVGLKSHPSPCPKGSNVAMRLLITGAALFCLVGSPAITRAEEAPSSSDAVDDFVRSEMQRRQVPGLSLAIIQDGKIVKAKGYGVIEKGGNTPVTPSTLFQAGSISKPVAAFGALRLVQEGKLTLDDDVNSKLTTWKVPENEFTREKKVTLRGLLSHTAGLTVHGFPGYATDKPVPSLVQVLDGEKPANTRAIRVDVLPGSLWRYSGGGYSVSQQLAIDVTQQPYPRFMQETVLGPLGMDASTYEQPLPSEKAALTATAHTLNRTPVKGRWHLYPEMAAAGLWTTPSDLARFAMGVQEAATGRSKKVLSQEMTRQMLTEQKNHYGLGVSVQGSGTTLRFGHGGRDNGFDAQLVAYAETGQGAAVMINTNDNSAMVSRILMTIAREYHWPDYPSLSPSKHTSVELAEHRLDRYTGRYEFENNQMITFIKKNGHLCVLLDGIPDEDLLAEAEDRFFLSQRDVHVTFLTDRDGGVKGFLWKDKGKEKKVPRIGPLFHSLKPQTDPDPARTETVFKALKALQAGGKDVADSPLLTPGARKDFGSAGTRDDLRGMKALVFLAERDVSDQAIERHEKGVHRILHYRLVTDDADRYLLAHLTTDGLMTDYDIVED